MNYAHISIIIWECTYHNDKDVEQFPQLSLRIPLRYLMRLVLFYLIKIKTKTTNMLQKCAGVYVCVCAAFAHYMRFASNSKIQICCMEFMSSVGQSIYQHDLLIISNEEKYKINMYLQYKWNHLALFYWVAVARWLLLLLSRYVCWHSLSSLVKISLQQLLCAHLLCCRYKNVSSKQQQQQKQKQEC